MRYFKFIIAILLVISLQGCVFDNPRYLNLNSKPNDYYYSSLIYKNLKKGESFTLKVFDTNFYKYYTVDEEDKDILLNFFESLNNNNYLSELETPDKSKYELCIEFSNEKYIINIYDNSSITIYPWDGNFVEDKITMDGVSPYNNLYLFCSYVINKSHSRSGN